MIKLLYTFYIVTSTSCVVVEMPPPGECVHFQEPKFVLCNNVRTSL